MNRHLWLFTLTLLLHLTLYTAGGMIPGNVTVHIWEGNVTVTWNPPEENPGDYLYQVQLTNYSNSPEVWFSVSHCTLIKASSCNIGYLSVDSYFKVRVGVLTSQNTTFWSYKRNINIRLSQLIAPTFDLSSTSNSMRIKIHRKPILDTLFPYGVQYTTYLWPDGEENQTLTQSDDDMDADGEMTFISLQSLQVYCVFVKVESKASGVSNISSVHCIKLPLDVTVIIGFTSLGPLCIMAFLMLFICFLRRPQKMPSALKPAVNIWKPMIIESDILEIVTDKGWIITNKADRKKSIEFSEDDEERRGSLDSGVSIEQLHLSISDTKTEGEMGDVQVDSGCESLKGTEVSGSVSRVTRQLSIHEKNQGTDDSGLGLGHHEISASLEGEDTGLLSEVVVGDGYRSQSPSSVDAQNDMDSNMAAPSAGYRSGQVACMCSVHEYCMWCKFKSPLIGTRSQADCRQMDDSNSVRSNYLKKSFIQTVNVPSTEPALSENTCTEDSLLLLSCPLLLQCEETLDCTMPTRSFTLNNMELTFS